MGCVRITTPVVAELGQRFREVPGKRFKLFVAFDGSPGGPAVLDGVQLAKDSMKRRGISSPDLGDALALACYPSGWLGGGGAWAVAV